MPHLKTNDSGRDLSARGMPPVAPVNIEATKGPRFETRSERGTYDVSYPSVIVLETNLIGGDP